MALGAIEEITVTTRRKEENLQEVPIAVTAITAEQIERQGISNLADIARQSSSVQFDTGFGPQDTRVTIRGLSNTRGRSNVAFLVDGIDVTTESLITSGSGLTANRRLLSDIQGIEIVKGPQSALYGRAAFAGAISYTTREPGPEWDGNVSADFDNYGKRQGSLAVGGPVFGDYLGVRVNGLYWSEDGYYRNAESNGYVGGGEGYGTSLVLVSKPLDGLKIKGRVEFSQDNNRPPPTIRITGTDYLPYIPQATKHDPLGCNTNFTTSSSGATLPLGQYYVIPPQGFATPIQAASCPTDSLTSYGTNYALTGLYDVNPNTLPFAIPRSFGSGTGQQITQSENWRTGGDYPGTELRTLRGSIGVTYERDWGAVTSYTGFLQGDNTQLFDQDFQANGRPDQILGMLETNTTGHTNQFSQELRYVTPQLGPVQLTLGSLYWKENQHVIDNNLIVDCIGVSRSPAGVSFSTAGVCDGTNGTVGPTRVYQTVAASLANPPLTSTVYQYTDAATGTQWAKVGPAAAPYTGAPWDRDTEHFSFYLSADYAMTDQLGLRLEDRYITEKEFQQEPNQSSCSFIGNNGLLGPLLDQSRVCKSIASIQQAIQLHGDQPFQQPDPSTSNLDWALIGGTVRTNFHTPKVTMNYQVTPEDLLYFSWAKGEKPAGINGLNPGGTANRFEDLLFKAEKVYAYEMGAKTSWQAKGALVANVAVFLEDYHDKQVTTSVVVNNQLQPRVVNAAGAQSSGVELDLIWAPEFIDGVTAKIGYTYLSARYTDFKQFVRTANRIMQSKQCVPSFYLDSLTGNPTPFCQLDYSGNSLERTPAHSGNASLAIQRPFPRSQWEWFSEFDVQYQGSRYLDEDNYTKFDPYWLMNLRFGLQSDHWDFTGYINNLTDDRTIKTGGSGPDWGTQLTNQLGFPGGFGVLNWFAPLPDPRVVGLRATYRFGASR